VLEGLSAKQYNGQTGVCSTFDEAARRYAVKLDKSGKSLKVKVANLKVRETVGGFGKGFMFVFLFLFSSLPCWALYRCAH